MNPQDLRLDIAGIVRTVAPQSWAVSTETFPEWTDPLIQIGHCSSIRESSYRYRVCDLTVTLWVNEGDAEVHTEDFYALLADDDGLRAVLFNDKRVQRADIVNCGPREQGPVGWLAGDIDLSVLLTERS